MRLAKSPPSVNRQCAVEKRDLPEKLVRRLRELAKGGTGFSLVLVGQAGIGKSHTARALTAGLPFRTLTWRAAASPGAIAATIPSLDRLSPWAESVLARARAHEAVDGQQFLEALLAALAVLAPVVVVLEDLHEAGTEQGEFWAGLAGRIHRLKGVGLVATSRVRPAGVWDVFEVAPLDDESIHELLERQVSAVLPTAAKQWIAERAAGNPLFGLEYFRYLARNGNLWSDGSRWRWRSPELDRLPVNIEALITRRLSDSCATSQHRLVAAALAFLGSDGEPPELTRFLSLSDVQVNEVLRDLRTAGILLGDSFVHPLFREVAERHLPSQVRSEISSRALERFAREPLRAVRYVEFAQTDDGQAFDVLSQAASLAEAGGDRRLAGRLLAQAAEFANCSDRAPILLKAAQLLSRSDVPLAQAVCQRLLVDSPENPEALLLHAELLVLAGRHDEVAKTIEPIFRGNGMLKLWLGLDIILQAEAGKFAEALRTWQENEDVRGDASPRTIRAVAFALQQLGRLDEAEELLREALGRGEQLTAEEKAELLQVRAAAKYYRRDYPGAIQDWSEVATLLENGHNPVLRGRALGNRGMALRFEGRHQEAMASAEEAANCFAELGLGRDYARQRHNLANLHRQRAEFERAEEMFLEVRDVFEAMADTAYRVACDIDLFYLYLTWNPPLAGPLALRHAHLALHGAEETGLPGITSDARRTVALAEACYGSAERALVVAGRVMEEAREPRSPSNRAAALAALARVEEARGREGAARELLREAVRLEREVGSELQSLDFAIELARLERDQEQAARYLATFREYGQLDMVHLVHRYFPELAERSPVAEPVEGRDEVARGSRRGGNESIRIDVLGPARFVRGDKTIDFRARKGRQLLAILVEARLARRDEVGQLELTEALYPGADEEAASAALQQLVYRVRKVLGDEAVLRTHGGYSLGRVETDADEFLASGNLELWRGRFLEGIAEEDSEARRRLLEALQSALERVDPAELLEAERLIHLLLEESPFDRQLIAWGLELLSGRDPEMLHRFRHRASSQLREVGEQLELLSSHP